MSLKSYSVKFPSPDPEMHYFSKQHYLKFLLVLNKNSVKTPGDNDDSEQHEVSPR